MGRDRGHRGRQYRIYLYWMAASDESISYTITKTNSRYESTDLRWRTAAWTPAHMNSVGGGDGGVLASPPTKQSHSILYDRRTG